MKSNPARRCSVRPSSLLLGCVFSLLGSLACNPPNAGVEPKASVAPPTPAATPASTVRKAEERRLAALRPRLEALASDAIGFWKAHGPDAKHGGFHGTLDRSGNPIEPSDKGVIQTARHLWAFSTWHARREPTPKVRAVADDLYRFLERYRDPADGEFYFRVNRSGEPVERRKQLYAESFVIYALSAYATSFDSEEARSRALTCFRAIDRRSHDPEWLGYDQTHDPGWLSPGAEKETNTHIHLLEAFTALFRATKDGLVRARLEEMVTVVAKKIVQPDHHARKEYERDWTPFGDASVSYGHDIETAWLLLDALDALERSSDAEFTAIALQLGRGALDAGYDATRGGLFEEGPLKGPATKREKIWWIQAEALPGLYRLYALSRDPSLLDRLEQTLSFIENYQRDAEHGEWYWGITEAGAVGPRGSNKGEEWKASYHNVRALLFTSDWIAERSRPGAPPVTP